MTDSQKMLWIVVKGHDTRRAHEVTVALREGVALILVKRDGVSLDALPCCSEGASGSMAGAIIDIKFM
jgi:hypothetical protein